MLVNLYKKIICSIFGHKIKWNEGKAHWKEFDDGCIKHISGIKFTTWECTRCGVGKE